MPARLRFLNMSKDDLVWEKLEADTEQWGDSVRTNDIYRAVGNFILKYRKAPPEVVHKAIKGGYNTIYRLEYKDDSSVIMRVPIKGTP